MGGGAEAAEYPPGEVTGGGLWKGGGAVPTLPGDMNGAGPALE